MPVNAHRSCAPRPVATAAATTMLALLGGCAAVPDVTLSYRLAQWELAIAVVHTITCSTDGKTMIVDRSATSIPVFRARPTGDPKTLKLRELDSVFADTELKVEFTDDGRLKSINQSSAGQGEAILKAAVSAAGSLSAATMPLTMLAKNVDIRGVGIEKTRSTTRQADPSAVCKLIAERIPQAPSRLLQVSITQTAVATETELKPKPEMASEYQRELSSALSQLGVALSSEVVLSQSSGAAGKNLQPIALATPAVGDDDVALHLQKLEAWTLDVSDEYGGLVKREFALPSKSTFSVPIPRSALFGKQGFNLALAESGRIVSIGYSRGQGVTGALGALGSAAGVETTFDNAKTAALKAAADLVDAHQRAAKCAMTPDKC